MPVLLSNHIQNGVLYMKHSVFYPCHVSVKQNKTLEKCEPTLVHVRTGTVLQYSGLSKRFRVAGVAKRVGDATQNTSCSDCCLDHSHENKATSI